MDYKEKLRLAKEALDSSSYDKETIEYIFPELKESEDEKIRKKLIEVVKGDMVVGGTKDKQLAIAWLEKQGTPAKLSEEEQNRFAKGVLTSCASSFIDYLDAHKHEGKMCVSNGECEDIENAFHNAMWDKLHRYYGKYIEKQGEQILANTAKTCKDEPKPWSEEDEKVIHCLEYTVRHFYEDEDTIKWCCDWLKSLKDRVGCEVNCTTTKEWSEEDEQYLLICKNALNKYQVSDQWDAAIISRWLENRLKSLRPRSQWKPSDEQIGALEHFVRSIAESGFASPYDSNTKLVYSLFNDLKKLREE